MMPGLLLLGVQLLCLCMYASPIKVLMNLNKAMCQFLKICPELRIWGFSPTMPDQPARLRGSIMDM